MENSIHESAFLGPDVVLGTGNVIGPFAVVLGPTAIGNDNWIGPHAVIGGPGEIRGGPHPAQWDGEFSNSPGVRIGDGNIIRELVTVQQGALGPTTIGNNCYLMNKVHVGHDARVASGVTLSSAVLVGGHSRILEFANVGLGTVMHQRLAIGEGAMVGMGSVVTRHIPPYAMAYGSPCRVHGANVTGLRRQGFSDSIVDDVERMYRNDPDWRGENLLAIQLNEFEQATSEAAEE